MITEEEQRIIDKYTEIKECLIDGGEVGYNSILKVGNQSFCVSPIALESREEAEWTCHMLAKAILVILKEDS